MENNTIDKEALEVYQKLIDMGLSESEILDLLEKEVFMTAFEMLPIGKKLDYILNSDALCKKLSEELDIAAIKAKYKNS